MSERQAKEPWRRHFLIRRRADWLRDVMASDLGAPAKNAAYALTLYLDKDTMRTPSGSKAGVSQATLAAHVGMCERRLRAALDVLVKEGWLERKDDGRNANVYSAIDQEQLMGTESSSQRKQVVRTKASSQPSEGVRTESSSQLPDQAGDEPPVCEDGFDTFVGTVSVGTKSACEDVFGRLSGRNRPHLYKEDSNQGADAEPSAPLYGGPRDGDELDPLGGDPVGEPPPLDLEGLDALAAAMAPGGEPLFDMPAPPPLARRNLAPIPGLAELAALIPDNPEPAEAGVLVMRNIATDTVTRIELRGGR